MRNHIAMHDQKRLPEAVVTTHSTENEGHETKQKTCLSYMQGDQEVLGGVLSSAARNVQVEM